MYVELDDFNAEMFAAWRLRLTAARHRGIVVIAGAAEGCRAAALQILAASGLESVSWVSNIEQPGLEVVNAKQAKGLLGQERDAVVFDAHSGFDADAFGAVSGTIVGGGLLVLLCPPLAAWSQFADPAAESIAVWPHAVDDLSGRFLRRLSRLLEQSVADHAQIVLISLGDEMDVPLAIMQEPSSAQPIRAATDSAACPAENEKPDGLFRSDDQRAAVAAIEHVLHGHRRRPLVLIADRGRGKTAALGIAAAQLLRDASHGRSQKAHTSPRALRILVTAPRLAAVEPLFQQALKILPKAITHAGRLQWGDAEIQFVAPDALCGSLPSADLLLVDEAAAIPVSILQPLLAHYSRIVFSTTTHGYEGTGRGFAVRFRQTLNAQTPGWSEQLLREPIRWAQGDPLERLVFDSLLLNAQCAEDNALSSVDVATLKVERISRDRLVEDEALLGQLFGLLVVAHYRTRPNDLRNLLDGPGLAVYAMLHQGAVLATALVAVEGGFDAPLIEEIAAGRRRPRGHLIPQSLVAHVGLKAAGVLRCARVLRIAVHSALQRRGLGRQMLRHIRAEAKKQGADLFGASFGATPSLLKFWRSENLWPVRIGFRREQTSGEHSVMVLSALSDAGETIVSEARERLLMDLPPCLAGPLSQLNPAVVAVLLQLRSGLTESHGETKVAVLSPRDYDNLCSFVLDERRYEDCLASIWRCLLWALQHSKDGAVSTEQSVLINKVLQKHSWAELSSRFHLAGKAGVKRHLQRGLRQLLDKGLFDA